MVLVVGGVGFGEYFVRGAKPGLESLELIVSGGGHIGSSE